MQAIRTILSVALGASIFSVACSPTSHAPATARPDFAPSATPGQGPREADAGRALPAVPAADGGAETPDAATMHLVDSVSLPGQRTITLWVGDGATELHVDRQRIAMPDEKNPGTQLTLLPCRRAGRQLVLVRVMGPTGFCHGHFRLLEVTPDGGVLSPVFGECFAEISCMGSGRVVRLKAEGPELIMRSTVSWDGVRIDEQMSRYLL